nr:putative reverse transcriptase domain-containing protein [Tanacetum cinerariifolium]
SRQKSYADVKRKPMEFEVGDMVVLKVLPWKGVIRFGKHASLGIRPGKTSILRPATDQTTSTIIHSKVKSKDKGKRILVEEHKPLKKQAQIKQDKQYARELEAELNKNIDWDEVIDHVNKKAKEDNVVKRYQALKRKPQTKVQARKNMMIYLKNVVGFKMDYFKESSKMQKLDEEVEELKRHLQIVPNEEDDVYTEATPLALKVPVVDYEIYNKNNKPYYKIKRADGSHQLYLKRFATTKPKNFSDDYLLITLGAMFKKPDIHAQIWKNQRSLILLVEWKYPITKFTLNLMLNNVRLKVEEESEVSLELLSFGVDAAMDLKKNMLSV